MLRSAAFLLIAAAGSASAFAPVGYLPRNIAKGDVSGSISLKNAPLVGAAGAAAGGRSGRASLRLAPAAGATMALKNDLMVRCARGEQVERTPVWLFRQAGRHLPEYTEYKKQTGKNFLELLKDPKDVAECTLQPIRRYELDAAILFSDILVVAEALGIEVEMPGGKGILVPNPLTSPEDASKRVPDSIDVSKELKHVIDAVKLIKVELKDKVPLIGFSAAPWTLMYYMVGGSSKKNQEEGERWLKEHPEAAKRLMDILTDVVIDYTSAQVDAGADMIQIFEAMGMFISEESFRKHAMPCMEKIAKELRKRHPDTPLLVFPRGATYSLVDLQRCGYDIVTMDTKTDRVASRKALGEDAAKSAPPTLSGKASGVQGNIDVAVLHEDNGSVEQVEEAVDSLFADIGTQNLIANLGEGLTGKESPKLVKHLVDTIHSKSEAIIGKKEAAAK